MLNPMVAILISCLVLFSPCPLSGQESGEGNRVRARIGIRLISGGDGVPASSREIVTAGDRIRVYVIPEALCYVYCIHADETRVKLLSPPGPVLPGSIIVLPSKNGFYTVDGNSSMETLSIIVTPERLPELSSVEKGRMTVTSWGFAHDYLARKSRIVMSRQADRPFSIAGNVRGDVSPSAEDTVVRDLKIYSGKGFLVKDYEFMVKN